MVWPPGVRGLLVTEAVRGEGGILRNKDGERFMWTYLPEERRAEYAATDEEASRWVTALSEGRETDARRPPELSTRDNVARAIYTEVREGRGSPHGGVFLDISYLPPDLVRRKLPSMYEQFKELADVDITTGPMEVGPTTHYVMGGIRVDAGHGRDHGARACTRRARSPAACTARTGSAATRCRTCSCSARGRARRLPRLRPSWRTRPISTRSQIVAAERELDAPLERADGEDPYALQRDAAGHDAAARRASSGSRPTSTRRSMASPSSGRAGRTSRSSGGRAYNPGWNLVFELGHLLIVSEAITRSARQRTESRGAHSRLDHPDADDKHWGQRNSVVALAGDGTMAVTAAKLPKMPA